METSRRAPLFSPRPASRKPVPYGPRPFYTWEQVRAAEEKIAEVAKQAKDLAEEAVEQVQEAVGEGADE